MLTIMLWSQGWYLASLNGTWFIYYCFCRICWIQWNHRQCQLKWKSRMTTLLLCSNFTMNLLHQSKDTKRRIKSTNINCVHWFCKNAWLYWHYIRSCSTSKTLWQIASKELFCVSQTVHTWYIPPWPFIHTFFHRLLWTVQFLLLSSEH